MESLVVQSWADNPSLLVTVKASDAQRWTRIAIDGALPPDGTIVLALNHDSVGGPVKTPRSAPSKPYDPPPALYDHHWTPPAVTAAVPKDELHAYIEATRAYHAGLDDDHRAVLLQYTKNVSKTINKVLRFGKPVLTWTIERAAEFEKTLNEVIDGAPPLPFDLVVFRGVVPTKGLDVRASFVEKGFASTSTSYAAADAFGGETVSIALDKGSTFGFYIGALWPEEAEMLLHSGLTMEWAMSISEPDRIRPIVSTYRVRK